MLRFGQTVLFWRTHRGLTQDELAARAHLAQPNLSAIERGSREVSLRTIRSLALALDVRPGILVDGEPPAPETHWSRERLERVARAAAYGRPLTDPDERSLVTHLTIVMRSKLRASGHPGPWPRRHKRKTEQAWMLLKAQLSRKTIATLINLISSHARHGTTDAFHRYAKIKL